MQKQNSMQEIFTTDLQREKADYLINNPDYKLSLLKGFQLQDIAIHWSYYSGKIEGSTYTFIQTETLLKDDIAKGRFSDALMHKNMYNLLIQEMDYIRNEKAEEIDEKLIFRCHKALTKNLISDEERGQVRHRPVSIGGTSYIPPKDKNSLQMELSSILFEQKNYSGIEKAIFLHCNLARLQPFIDGNKRTARMIEAIVLMNNDLLPTFSSDNDSFSQYREALVAFYETKDYTPYVDFMLDTQIEIAQRLSFESFSPQKGQNLKR